MSDLTEWIAELYRDAEMLRMGHGQRADDLNLGLGWIYYGFARALRPQTAVVIGSYRGFVPLVLGRALMDNANGGRVLFLDPSMVDNFWKDADAVQRHFASHGVSNIEHFRMTTQDFVRTKPHRGLTDVGLVFVDGYHTQEQARYDFEAFRDRLAPDGVFFFHDSITIRPSRIYGEDKSYDHTVRRFIDALKCDSAWQVVDVPVDGGVTLVRRRLPTAEAASRSLARAGTVS